MQDAFERWQEIESKVDDLFDAEEAAALPPPPAEGPAEVGRHGVAPKATPTAPGVVHPIDRPLRSSLGELLGEAMQDPRRWMLGIGEEVGPYRIEDIIGEGGMGTVFLARRADGSFDQSVALKLLHRSPADEDAHRRFLQERQILAGMKHPHIARLLDGGVIRGMPYLVMEYIEGLTLTDFCDQRQLGREERLKLLLQACDAIRYAHRQGIVHRDLKPSNLLVEEGPRGEARVVVLDFGIALIEHADGEVTSTGQIFGTPGYMSPEQALGHRPDIDRRSDIYSLGVLLFELLSGHRPYDGKDARQVFQNLMFAEPAPLKRYLPGVSQDLATITDTCLAREPSRRYDSVRALVQDLESYLDGGPIAARPLGSIERWWRRARQRPEIAALIVVASTITVASLLLLVIMAIRHTRDLQIERNAAIEARREAEGLLDFMLEDLHQGLDQVGRLDLLQQVAQKSLDYFDRRPTGGSAADRQGRAVALYNAGQILEEQGDGARALKAFEQSRQLFAALHAEEAQPRWLLETARAHMSSAGVFSSLGESTQGLQQAERAVSLCRRIAEQGKSPPGWAELYFDSLAIQGWLSREIGATQQALRILEQARGFAIDRADGSEEVNAWRYREAVALSFIGLVHQQEGSSTAALASFEPARDLCERLVAEDPGNNVWREELQLVLARIGSAFLDLGDFQAATEVLQEALQQSEILVRREPANPGWIRELAVVYATLASCQHQTGDLPGALHNIEQSLAITRSLSARFPDNHSIKNDLAWDLLDLGRVRKDLGAEDGAVAAWTEAVDIMRTVPPEAPDSAYYLDTEVQALLELGRIDEARPLAQQLHAAGWVTPDFLALCEEHGLILEEVPAGAAAAP